MIKKKARKKAATKKTAQKKSPTRSKKEFNPAEVRKQISKLVGSQAQTMTKAVIEEGMKGQVSPVKFLFEMASIFPGTPEGEQATTNEESLAQTLLRRLKLPLEPIQRDEDDETKDAVVVTKPAAKTPQDGDGELKDSGSESKVSDESKSPVLV